MWLSSCTMVRLIGEIERVGGVEKLDGYFAWVGRVRRVDG